MHAMQDELAEGDLSSFCIIDSRYYDDLSRYAPSSSEYLDALRGHLEADRIHKRGIWYQVAGTGEPCSAQGFKIHLSANGVSAHAVLRAALPVLLKAAVAFKVIVDPFMLALINSKTYPRSGSGKFITIYPSATEFPELIQELSNATTGIAGPYILSDRRYRDSQVVFYRYGGFVSQERLTVQGYRTPTMVGPDGSSIPDDRAPFFTLPEGVDDPFETDLDDADQRTSLLSRYSIEGALSFSNAGGVYKAYDPVTEQNVIIKEARPNVGVTIEGDHDAIETLRKEHRVLQRLQPLGVAPKVVDYFSEWEHEFLVEEFIEGIPLTQYRATHDLSLLMNPNRTPDSVASFCSRWFQIAGALLSAIRACHAQDVIVGDLSPNNVLIKPDTMELRLIDMEGARFTSDAPASPRFFTPGFVSPSRGQDTPLSAVDDYYALGSVLYSLILPVQPHFRLSPGSKQTMLSHIAEDYGLPATIPGLIFSLMDGDVKQAIRVAEANLGLADAASEKFLRPFEEEASRDLDLEKELAGITSHILAETQLQRRDRLWPGDFRLYTTNPLSVAYGAIGVALYLKAQTGRIPSSVLDWIQAQKIEPSLYPPGLYIGLSGIAWGLAELGQSERAERVMRMAYESPLLMDCPDMFYGMAGSGLASLYFWQRTREGVFLHSAVQLGEALIARAETESSGYSWSNINDTRYCGFALGGSGIALFLLNLHRATGEARFLSYAKGAMDAEISRSLSVHDSISWPRSTGDTVYTPYLMGGNAGIGSVLVRFGSLLGEERYLDVARQAAKYVITKYAVLPGQFLGLSGIGEFLLDMYIFTHDHEYLQHTERLAEGVKLFRIETPSGIMFPGESLMRASLDFGTGSAGIGLFLHRLAHPGPRLFFDLLQAESGAHDPHHARDRGAL
jgi:serine/threonine protein kinase